MRHRGGQRRIYVRQRGRAEDFFAGGFHLFSQRACEADAGFLRQTRKKDHYSRALHTDCPHLRADSCRSRAHGVQNLYFLQRHRRGIVDDPSYLPRLYARRAHSVGRQVPSSYCSSYYRHFVHTGHFGAVESGTGTGRFAVRQKKDEVCILWGMQATRDSMTRRFFRDFFPPPRLLTMPSVGLDISDTAITFIELLLRPEGFEVGRFGRRLIPEGGIISGYVNDGDAV